MCDFTAKFPLKLYPLLASTSSLDHHDASQLPVGCGISDSESQGGAAVANLEVQLAVEPPGVKRPVSHVVSVAHVVVIRSTNRRQARVLPAANPNPVMSVDLSRPVPETARGDFVLRLVTHDLLHRAGLLTRRGRKASNDGWVQPRPADRRAI